ncbi:phage portal protein [bacterium]|nr:phage portal protein [bacterium]
MSYPLDALPEDYFLKIAGGAVPWPNEVTANGALALSPFYAALRLYQRTVGSLPLVTYKDGEAGRERDKSNPAYYLLHAKPNPAMSRAVFWEHAIRDLFLRGEFFAQIIRKGTGEGGAPAMILPVPYSSVEGVRLVEVADAQIGKTFELKYLVHTTGGREIVPGRNMIHVMNYPDPCSYRGLSLVSFAAQSLALHSQVQTAGTAFFTNAVRPSGYISWPGTVQPEPANELAKKVTDIHAGVANRGKTLWLSSGGKWEPFSDTTAEEAKIIEALSTSVADIARWFGCSPGDLGDTASYHYSTLDADRAAFYSRSVAPLLDKIELAVNDKLFGVGSDTYCEFLVDALLRGDPAQQSQIDTAYIQAGVYTRQEVRRWKNLPDIPGLDTPLFPLNQGPEQAGEDTGGDAAPVEVGPELSLEELKAVMEIVAAVEAGNMPVATAQAVVKAAFPNLPPDRLAEIFAPLLAEPTPEPAPVTEADAPTPTLAV